MSFLAEDDYPGAARPQAAAWSQRSRPQPWPDEDPAYGEPSYGEPAYAEPGYYEPGYREPGYPEPGYYRPADREPGYYEPNYEPEYYAPQYYEHQYSEPQYSEPARVRSRTARASTTRTRIRRPTTGIRGTIFRGRPSRMRTWTTEPILRRPRAARATGRIAAGGGTAGAASGPSGWPASR